MSLPLGSRQDDASTSTGQCKWCCVTSGVTRKGHVASAWTSSNTFSGGSWLPWLAWACNAGETMRKYSSRQTQLSFQTTVSSQPHEWAILDASPIEPSILANTCLQLWKIQGQTAQPSPPQIADSQNCEQNKMMAVWRHSVWGTSMQQE